MLRCYEFTSYATEYTDFENKNGSFDGDEFIWKIKYIRDGNSNLWNKKYSLPCTKVLGFFAYRVTSKVIGIGEAERSWGDVKTIKSEKYLLSEVMYQRNIVLFIYLYVLNQI